MKSARLNLIASAVAAVGFAYLAFRGIDLHAIRGAVNDVNLWYVFPYLALLGLGQVFRTWRWQVLLNPLVRVPLRRLVPIATVGYTAIFTIPWLGELVRPYLVREEGRVRGSAALATVVVERVLDGLIVSITTFIAVAPLIGRPGTPMWVLPVALGALSLFVGAFGFLALAVWKHELAVRITNRTLGLLSQRLAHRAVSVLDAFLDGLRALPGRETVLGCVVLSVVYWVLNAAAMYVLMLGFKLGIGWQGAFAMMGIIVFGFLVPAGPGQVGNFHFFAGRGLSLFLPAALAGRGALYVVVLHAAQVAWYLTTGVIAMFSSHVSLAKVFRAATSQMAERELEAAEDDRVQREGEAAQRSESNHAGSTAAPPTAVAPAASSGTEISPAEGVR